MTTLNICTLNWGPRSSTLLQTTVRENVGRFRMGLLETWARRPPPGRGAGALLGHRARGEGSSRCTVTHRSWGLAGAPPLLPRVGVSLSVAQTSVDKPTL